MQFLLSFITSFNIVERNIDIFWVDFDLRAKLYPTACSIVV